LQALSRFVRRAAQYGVSLALWEEGQMAVNCLDVLNSCIRMQVFGALVHIRGVVCNSLATAPDRLANALTDTLSQ